MVTVTTVSIRPPDPSQVTTMPSITDFGELKNDKTFIETVNNFSKNLDKIDETISVAVDFKDFDELSTQEKVKYDNYLAYTINSLYWMYVKLQGADPNEHGIKNELSRVRQTILRDKQIHERNTIRPVLDKGAAGRFIKHGLHKKREKENGEEESSSKDETHEQSAKPLNKKIRFNSDSE